jgi:hypothetical protein
MALAGGLAAGGFLMASPSVAGAQSDPIGPTVAQLEATYAQAVASVEATATPIVEGVLGLEGFGYLLNPGCLASIFGNGIPGLGGGPPSPNCL